MHSCNHPASNKCPILWKLANIAIVALADTSVWKKEDSCHVCWHYMWYSENTLNIAKRAFIQIRANKLFSRLFRTKPISDSESTQHFGIEENIKPKMIFLRGGSVSP